MSKSKSKSKSNFVLLCKVPGEIQANVLKSHLESEGIPAILKYETAGLVYGVAIDGIGEVRILVPEELLEEARQVIEPQEGEMEGEEAGKGGEPD